MTESRIFTGLTASIMSLALSTTALSAPVGGEVVGGKANIDNSIANETHINQSTQKAAIDWQSFDVNKNELVQFHQPSSSAIALNRVVGSVNPSSILGTLKANGQVILVNPNGVYFGKDAVVDVSALIASTANITNKDFMDGKMNFTIAGNPDAKIINDGQINVGSGSAKEHGLAALVAPTVVNSKTGVIRARLGKVQLSSADTFTIDTYGDGLINFSIDGDSRVGTQVANAGEIAADGGSVYMTAATASSVLDEVVNMSGKISANSIEEVNGEIILGAGNGTAKVSGKLSAKGGKVQVTGKNVVLTETAHIDVSAPQGGGEVLIGGDYQGKNSAVQNAITTTVMRGAIINADATDNGDGGRVIVWADEDTKFEGSISARGGENGGNGGFVETSGKKNLLFNGHVNVAARQEDFENGQLLLDPENAIIDNLPEGSQANDAEIGDKTILAADGGLADFFISYEALTAALMTGSVTIEANNSVSFRDSANAGQYNSGSSSSLTLTAPTVEILREILLSNGTVFGNGNIFLRASTLNLGARLYTPILNYSELSVVNVLNNNAVIQQAIDQVSFGGKVNIADGIYNQTFSVKQPITVSGESEEGTIIAPYTPMIADNEFLTSWNGTAVQSIIQVQDTNATIQNLTIDGSNFDVASGDIYMPPPPPPVDDPTLPIDMPMPMFLSFATPAPAEAVVAGIGFDNAGGTVQNVTVKNMADTSLEGGTGIFADVDSNHMDFARTLDVKNSTILNSQYAGIHFNGDSLSGLIDSNTVTGNEDTYVGIAATDLKNSESSETVVTEGEVTISNNMVDDHDYAGILGLNFADLNINNNTLNDNYTGIIGSTANNAMINMNDIYGTAAETFGIDLYDTSGATVDDNYLADHEDGIYSQFGMNNTISNNTINNAESTAIWLWQEQGTNVSDNTIFQSGSSMDEFDKIGIFVEESGSDITVDNNTLNYTILTPEEPSYYYYTSKYGIWVKDTDGVDVDGNFVSKYQYGIYADSSDNTNIVNNNVNTGDDQIPVSTGITSILSDSVLIDNNTIQGSNTGIIASSGLMKTGSYLVNISNNTVSEFSNYGIQTTGRDLTANINGNTINQTAYEGGNTGIYINNSDATINNNTVTIINPDYQNAGSTTSLINLLFAQPDISINNNTLTGGNGFGTGVYITETADVTMSGNTINGNQTGVVLDGIGRKEKPAIEAFKIKSFDEEEGPIDREERLSSTSLTFTGPNNFNGNVFYIALNQGIMTEMVLDASGSFFDGVLGSNMDAAAVAAAEDKAVDVEDFLPEITRGDVFFGDGTGSTNVGTVPDQQNQQVNSDFSDLFSYTGQTINVNNNYNSTQFNLLGMNLTMLAGGGNSNADLASLEPAAGDETGGRGNDESCGNSFLKMGWKFNSSGCQ